MNCSNGDALVKDDQTDNRFCISDSTYKAKLGSFKQSSFIFIYYMRSSRGIEKHDLTHAHNEKFFLCVRVKKKAKIKDFSVYEI